MKNNPKYEISLMIQKIIKNLHFGYLKKNQPLIKKMRTLSVKLDEKIKQDVIDFIQQIDFQTDYDPKHLVTKEIKKSADRLIRDLEKKL